MTLLIDICNLDWLSYLLFWALIPILLGLLLGWAIWARWKSRARELEANLKDCRDQNADLEKELVECRKSYTQVDSENAMLRGQLTELKRELDSLSGEGEKETASKGAAVPTGTQPRDDDLKIIEGIGPKVEELLKTAGIRSWQELASTDVDRLREIIQGGGERFRLMDPATWPRQAKLAARGAWSELEELQERLDKGKDPGAG
jgi:predicted flap endonuclease-1-like 5' DNA nuclease